MAFKNSGLNLGAWFASALALVPMVLWPCFVTASCCCTERDLQAAEAFHSMENTPEALGAEPGSAVPQAQEFGSSGLDSCPACARRTGSSPEICVPEEVTDKTDAASQAAPGWIAACECQPDFAVPAVTPRMDRSVSDHWGSDCVALAESTGVRLGALNVARMSRASDAILHSTAGQRCALLCCWLN